MSISRSSLDGAGDTTLSSSGTSRAGPSLELGAGRLLAGRYELGVLIGSGGMGLVYEALHLGLGSKVALKVLRPELLEQPGLVERFVQEGRCMAALSSDHVVRVMDAGRLETGLPFLAMERLFGLSLLHVLEACGRLSAPNAVDYALQACAGLADIHAAGLVHLDIKPGNLFVMPRKLLLPRVTILDLGIAQRIDGAQAQPAARAHGFSGRFSTLLVSRTDRHAQRRRRAQRHLVPGCRAV